MAHIASAAAESLHTNELRYKMFFVHIQTSPAFFLQFSTSHCISELRALVEILYSYISLCTISIQNFLSITAHIECEHNTTTLTNKGMGQATYGSHTTY